MTNHTTNPTLSNRNGLLSGEELDFDKLEALARAAAQHGDDIGEDEWYAADENMSATAGNPDLALISACSPVAILTLIALARAARQAPRVDAGAQAGIDLTSRLTDEQQCIQWAERHYRNEDWFEATELSVAITAWLHACAYARAALAQAAPADGEGGPTDRLVAHLTAQRDRLLLENESLRQAAPAVAADDFAVRFIEQRAEQYLQDHADTETGTGATVFEFGEAGRDYHSTLVELADDIRKAQAEASAVCTVPPAGWACTRAAGHDGPCAAIPADRATVVAPTVTADRAAILEEAAKICDEADKSTHPADLAQLIRAAEAAAQSQPAGAPRPTDDDLWDETLRDRDQYHEWADKLAEAIARHFGVDIGEHSNMNCPWAEALDVIEAAQPAGAGAPSILTWKERCGDTGLMPSKDQAMAAMNAEIADLRAHIARQGAAPAQAEPVAKSERAAWTTKQWYEHVGAWETSEGFISFGSVMALGAMFIQFQRAHATAPAPAGVAQADDARDAALEEAAEVADAERAEFMQKAGDNNGRESDFAFGSVNSAERIAIAIRNLKTGAAIQASANNTGSAE